MMAKWVGSPNYTSGRGGNKVTGVIIHWMVGTLASTDSVFQNTSRNTSAHYGIEDGNVHQYVKDEDTAYHAGHWDTNQKTIGIEHSAAPGRPASDATYEESAKLIASLSKKFGFAINRDNIRGHNQIVATQCPGTIDIDRLVRRANELVGGAAPAPTPTPPAPAPTPKLETVEVSVAVANVRSAPHLNAPLSGSKKLYKGDTFKIVGWIKGDTVSGISTWAISQFGNYVWAGNLKGQTSPPVANSSGTVQVLATALNVRDQPTTASRIDGTLYKGTAQYVTKTNGQTVSANGRTSNVWLQTLNGNWFSEVWVNYI